MFQFCSNKSKHNFFLSRSSALTLSHSPSARTEKWSLVNFSVHQIHCWSIFDQPMHNPSDASLWVGYYIVWKTCQTWFEIAFDIDVTQWIRMASFLVLNMIGRLLWKCHKQMCMVQTVRRLNRYTFNYTGNEWSHFFPFSLSLPLPNVLEIQRNCDVIFSLHFKWMEWLSDYCKHFQVSKLSKRHYPSFFLSHSAQRHSFARPCKWIVFGISPSHYRCDNDDSTFFLAFFPPSSFLLLNHRTFNLQCGRFKFKWIHNYWPGCTAFRYATKRSFDDTIDGAIESMIEKLQRRKCFAKFLTCRRKKNNIHFQLLAWFTTSRLTAPTFFAQYMLEH